MSYDLQCKIDALNKQICCLIEAIQAQPTDSDAALLEAIQNSDIDDTDDDVRPASVSCLEWELDGVTGQFTGYALTDETGQFVSWHVISGDAPPTGATVECVVKEEKCASPAAVEKLVKRTSNLMYDNGRTPGSSWNNCGKPIDLVRFTEDLEIVEWPVNNSVYGVGDSLGPFTGWADQLTGWAAFGTANDPNSNAQHVFGPLRPAPTWRFWDIKVCDPQARYGTIKAKTVVDGEECEFEIYPIFLGETFDTCYRYWEKDCNEIPVEKWLDEDKNPIEKPEDAACYVPCDYKFDSVIIEGAESPCTVNQIREVCDLVTDEEGVEISKTTFVQIVNLCGSEIFVDNYTIDSWNNAEAPDDLVEYEIVGQIVDCSTGLPVEEEPPPCPEGAVFNPVDIGGSYFILDNSNWAGLPVNHLQNGNSYELTFTDVNGVQTVVQQTADPYFTNIAAQIEAAMPGCKVVNVCANHTSPTGCNAGFVANLANYPAYDAPTFPGDVQNNLGNPDQSELWATGWLIDCGDCQADIARVEITAATDATHVGAFKEPKVYQKEIVRAYQAVTCEGVFYKDCDGNDIPAPACCPKPAATAAVVSTGLECALTECGGKCETAFKTPFPGRPDNTATFIYNPEGGEPISGASYQEFSAAMAAAGYTEWIDGEQHWFCPCDGGEFTIEQPRLTEITSVVCEPNPREDLIIPGLCALRTVGCNDDRRDNTLVEIKNLLDSVIGPCPACDGVTETVEYNAQGDATEQSYGIGDVIGDGTGGIKFDTSAADISPELQQIHQAIIDCINSGGVANTVITDQDGNTVELDLDVVGGDGNPQYFYGGTVIDGDPAGGKVRSMAVACSVSDETVMCIRTGPNCTNNLLEALCVKQDTTNTLLQELIDCLKTPCDETCEPSCAWGAGGIPVDNVWQPSESGLIWSLCGGSYVTPAGNYSNNEMAAWINNNTPYTMTVIPDPGDPNSVVVYLSIPCDCEAPTFQFGDDPPVTLVALPDFDVVCDGV